MKFYRRLSAIKAISFDLDDTLYGNKPIMLAIEKKMFAYFTDVFNSKQQGFIKADRSYNPRYWSPFREQTINAQPDLAHDVVQVRLVTYRLGLAALGFSDNVAHIMAQAALDYFIGLRSDFVVPTTSKQLLAALSKKYPLVAISNGNVDTEALGISQYFQHVYHAGWQANGQLLKQKPANDMFVLACQELAIKPKHLLHVGDCGRADIQGALQAGCQAAWLSCYDVGKPISVLPHLELDRLSQLEQLLLV